MSDQTTWIDLKNRTEEIQELVLQVGRFSTQPNASSEHLYREYNWGLTGNPVLCSALLRMRDTGILQNHQEILSKRGPYTDPSSGGTGVQEEDENGTIVIRRKPESIVTRDISWFIQNGETEEIKLKAREYRERALLDLYLEHVKQTGETYFPQLQQLLEAEWKFKIHGNDDD
jgi:hypothetical protein